MTRRGTLSSVAGNDAAGGALPSLVALDWGTSSVRAYLLDGRGNSLQTRSSDSGVMSVTAEAGDEAGRREAAFDRALDDLCGDWLRENRVPMVASGMIGSNQGWIEADYLDTPVNLLGDALPLTTVETTHGMLAIVPGLISRRGIPGVMRGEETQILGVLLGSAVDSPPSTIVLPGTHTKWVRLSDATVTDFATSMTGEVFGLLRSRSILARLAEGSPETRWDAFATGLDVAFGTDGDAGVLTTVFSARSMVMTGQLAPVDVEDYLSGLLIGTEVRGLTGTWLTADLSGRAAPVVLCGDQQLCARYARALARVAVSATTVAEQTTPAALFHIADRAGLVRKVTHTLP